MPDTVFALKLYFFRQLQGTSEIPKVESFFFLIKEKEKKVV